MPHIESPYLFSERILIYGTGGAGKSESCLSIARSCPGTVYVLDNDADWARALSMNPDVDNVTLFEFSKRDFMGMLECLRDLKGEVAEGDWVVIDSYTPLWEAAQNEFTERMFGKDLTELFVSYRRQMEATKSDDKNVQPMDGWKDWPVIKRLLSDTTQAILEMPCHVIMTGEAKAVDSKMDKGELLEMFEFCGAKPIGNKEAVVHLPLTIIYTKAKRGGHEMTTAKQMRGEWNGMPEPGVAPAKGSWVENPKPKGFYNSFTGKVLAFPDRAAA